MSSKKYTDEQLIKYYKQLGEEIGKTPTQKDVSEKRKTDNNFPSIAVLSRRIGFNKLAEICGFELNSKTYTRNDLLIILENYYHKHGIPTQSDFDSNPNLPSSMTYLKHFGGIRNALVLMKLVEKEDNYSIYQNMSDDEIFNVIIKYYNKNSSINGKDFVHKNGLPSGNYLRKRFGSLKVIYDKCNIPYDDMYFSEFKKLNKDELLNKLIWFNENVGFPTERAISKNKYMPSANLYFNHFGSFKNAILISGIGIPKERERYFDREKLSDEDMLSLLRYYTEKKFSNGGIFLLTTDEIDTELGMPSLSTYYNRLGWSIEKIYSIIGYDYYEFNKNALRKDMIDKYIKLHQELGRVPNSRDIDYFSQNRNGFYSMGAYEFNFGSLFKLQEICGVTPTKIGRNKSQEDLLNDLVWLSEKLHRTPLMMDLYKFDNIASSAKYLKEFGGFPEALSLAGLNPNTSIYYTKNGTKCLSYYELEITEWLENTLIYFEKEVLYKKVIKNEKTNRRFDWMIRHGEVEYYVEMFGRVGDKEYDKKVKNKIRTCKENNINLIAIYPEDFRTKSLEEIFSFLFT